MEPAAGGGGGGGGGSSGSGSRKRRLSCAVCKHQKRRCTRDCPTAPYFPSPPSQDLEDVQRLFGLGNLIKIRNGVPAGLRDHAMRTMIWEARMRRLDPVRGASGVLDRLAARVEAAQGELDSVRRQLALYQPGGQAAGPRQHQQDESPQCGTSTDGRNADEVVWEICLMLGGDEDVARRVAPSIAENAGRHGGQAAAPPADLSHPTARAGRDLMNPPPPAPPN